MIPFATEKTVVETLEEAEEAFFEGWTSHMEKEETLTRMARAWKQVFAGRAGLRSLASGFGGPVSLPGAADLPRGGESGLGPDTPSGLFRLTKQAWALAARTLSGQEALSWRSEEALRLSRLARAIETSDPPAFVPTPNRVVARGEGWRLRRFGSETACDEVPLLVVSSRINRWYILDFLPEQSFLGKLCEFGRPVFLLEWLPPSGDAADDEGLDAAVSGPMREAVQATGAEAVALCGYCMGGTLAAAFAARYPERVDRLATVGAPIRFADGGLFRTWFSPEHLDPGLVTAAYETIPAWLVHLPFWWLRPSIKTYKLTRLARRFEREGYLDYFLAVEVWNQDNIDMSPGTFRTWAGDFYQRDDLVRGRFVVEGRTVDLSDISCPTLVLTGRRDAIVPPASAEALVEAVASDWTRTVSLRAGHVGLLTAPGALKKAETALSEWLNAKRSRR